ncbi:MAG: diphthamide biosynthesis enzyme Dph2 [Nitrososphaeraceae archaeon]
MMIIDESQIFKIIEKNNPKSVSINGPEALLPKIQDTADKIMLKYNIPVYIIGDPCWGSCDLNTHAADVLGTDLLFNIGHTISMETFHKNVVMINAYDDIRFDSVAKKCANEIYNKYKSISILTNSQHLEQLEPIRKIFENAGFEVVVGKGKGHLNDSQVFGCEFYPAYEIKDQIDAYIFLGQSRFHTASIALTTNKPTFMLDPYYNEYIQINEYAEKIEKKAILSILKSKEANKIGIIIGLKEGQFAKIKALRLKRLLEDLGKQIQLIALTEITKERLLPFKDLDAYIQVACPRIATDNSFDKPMLSVPQADALIRLLKNKDIDDFLQIRHWL